MVTAGFFAVYTVPSAHIVAKFRQVAVHERKVAGSYIGGLLVSG